MLETNVAFRTAIANNDELSIVTDEQLARIKVVLLEMMDDIHATCEKHGLEYVLCGGSCLGAVRHGGYIPWDDDFDIGMPRKDYDRIGKFLEEDYPGKYWIQAIRDNPKVENNSMKIRKVGTKCVELFEPDPDTAGFFVDVFCVEDTYDNPLRRKLHGYHGELLILICSCVRMIHLSKKILPFLDDKKTIRTVKLKAAIGHLFFFRSLNSWVNRTENVLCKCNNPNSVYVSIPSGRKHYFGEMYKRDGFFPSKLVPFEDRQYRISKDPEEYLVKLFGDYMTIPKEKPERHAILELKF